jgi:hypothetical protein
VLIVDEVGYLATGDDAANVLYHVVNDRHIRRRAMVFTTNKHPKKWGAALHDEDLAEAIVDRILERGRLLRLDGPSVRTKHLPGDELADDIHTDLSGSKVSGTSAAEFPERTAREEECEESVGLAEPREVLGLVRDEAHHGMLEVGSSWALEEDGPFGIVGKLGECHEGLSELASISLCVL